MFIHRLTAFHVRIALKKPVRHASHTRSENETLIVRCVMNDGSVGWGEGLPRTYVTGESIDSVWRHLLATDFTPIREQRFDSAAAVAQAVDALQLKDIPHEEDLSPRECFGNSVRCALELAMLDAACRTDGISIGDLIHRLPESGGIATRRDQVFYSGAVTSLSPHKQWIASIKMRLFAFRQVKVKVGAQGIADQHCLSRVRGVVGPKVDLRLDANEAWQCDDVCSQIAPLLTFHPTCLEQPVAHSNVAGLAQVRRNLPVPIMLDESLCSAEDAVRAIQGDWCDAFNIRLSKCGGLVRSLRIAQMAQEAGLQFQLGCQVGETGILSAAGRHFACNIADIRYLEGSFDRFLVKDRLTEQDLTFRYGGRGMRIRGPGLGVDVNECRVRELACRSLELIRP
ncbi:MAG: enolase C-terminal domain-like protein [Planctomycetia bacterium]